MKYVLKIAMATLAMTTFSMSSAQAKTDVSAKIDQLKFNTESSKLNLAQYEENLKVSEQNLNETNKALKSLERQKLAVVKHKQEAAKGKHGVDAARDQIQGYLKAEQIRLDVEKKQIADLERALELLKKNQDKRESNILAYQEKLKAVEMETGAWSERNESIVELDKAISEKEALAKADQKKWSNKKNGYEDGVTKWKKQVRVSERDYESFKGLQD